MWGGQPGRWRSRSARRFVRGDGGYGSLEFDVVWGGANREVGVPGTDGGTVYHWLDFKYAEREFT